MAARLKRLADREDAPQSVVIRRALANLLDQVDDTPRAN
jgi:predicted transcriptional regulator